MKTKQRLFFFLFILVNGQTFAQAPAWIWARSAGSSGNESGYALAVDNAGNVYVTGNFDSPKLIFGKDTLTNSNTFADVFLVKYDANGNPLWARSAPGDGDDYSRQVAVDKNGNVFIAGSFSGDSISFANHKLTNSTSPNEDIFIAKYDSGGTVAWAKSAGGTGGEEAESLAIDPSGNIYITGYFQSPTLKFGLTTLSNTGLDDIFIAKYDNSGNPRWAIRGSGTDYDDALRIACDKNANIAITGNFQSASLTMGGKTITNSSGFPNILVFKFDSAGTGLWAKAVGGGDSDYGNAVAFDGSGNLFLTGGFYSATLGFGSYTLVNTNPFNYLDFYIAKFDPSGNPLWAYSAGSNKDDFGEHLTVDASGDVYITGSFSNDVSFGAYNLVCASPASTDMFAVKYSSAGALNWAVSAGGDDEDNAHEIACDATGNIYVCGDYLSASLSFSIDTLFNSGSDDVFLSKLSSSTGLQESFHPSASLHLYPNPAHNLLTIEQSSCTGFECTGTLFLLDMTGRIIFEQPFSNGKTETDVSRLAKGYYIAELITPGAVIKQQVIIE